MPGLVRINRDAHIGHDCPGGGPFHKTYYASGSANVFANNEKVVRLGDATVCGDRALVGSPNVFANNIAVHRRADATTGHGCWVPNQAETGSPNVYINEPIGPIAVTRASGSFSATSTRSSSRVAPPPPRQYQFVTGGSEGAVSSFTAGPGGSFVPTRELVSGRDYWPVNIYPWNFSPQIMDLRPFTPVSVEYQDWNLENQIANIANPPAIVYTWYIYEKTFQSAASYNMGFEVFTFAGDDRIFRPHSYAYSLLPTQQQKDLLIEYTKKYNLTFIADGAGYSWKDGPFTRASKEWRSFLIEKGVNLPINEIAVIKHGDTFRWDGSEWQLEEKHVRAVYVPKE